MQTDDLEIAPIRLISLKIIINKQENYLKLSEQ